MQLALSEEQQLLQDSFGKLFSGESSPGRVRAALPLGFDPALWAKLVDASVPLMRVREEQGGTDLSLLDAAIVVEQAGCHLASVPIVETLVAARLLAEAGKEGERWLSRLGSGEAIVVPSLTPIDSKPGQMITGGAVADGVVGVEGDELILVHRPRTGIASPNVGGLPLARWRLSGPEADGSRVTLLRGSRATELMEAAVEEWRLLTGSFLVGLSSRSLTMAAAYARTRVAFDRPIGAFQGIAHPLADAWTDVEAGRLLIWKAIANIARQERDSGGLIALAWWWVAKATIAAGRCSLRTFGGYGLSLEYDIQLYHRRGAAHVLSGGDPEESLAVAAARLFGGARSALPAAGNCPVSFSLPEEAVLFGRRVSEFIKANMTPAMRARAHHSTASHDRVFHKMLARAGLIFNGWPESPRDPHAASKTHACFAELEASGYTNHLIVLTDLVGQIVDRYGTQAARAEIVGRIKSGDAVCSLGFSEPHAGSDVFAAKVQALRQGDSWLIRGQKMFTTGGQYADYVLLLARTDLLARGHKGLTLFAVPTNLPGYSYQPIRTYQDETTNITFYSDLVLPDQYRLGEVGAGAAVMGAALSVEHGAAPAMFHGVAAMMEAALRWARTPTGGSAPLDRVEVRERFAALLARYECAQGFVAKSLWAADSGVSDRSLGPMSKVFVTEAHVSIAWEILKLAGVEGSLVGSDDLGLVELAHRRAYGATIYGGTSEIHRSLIAEQALGLPKSR